MPENPEIINEKWRATCINRKNWWLVGIGDEPPRDANGRNHSFNEIRAKVIEDSIEEELLASIMHSREKMLFMVVKM